MPRELVTPAANQVAFRDYQNDPLTAGQVRVRSRFGAAKHGTEMQFFKGYGLPRGAYDRELHLFRKENPAFQYPVPLGNICVGEVVEVGADVATVKLGDTVFRYSALREEHVWRAAEVRILPAGVPWQAAVCLDPADFALGAVRDGHVRIGDAVAVFGMGAIGLLVVQFAKLAGAYPIIAVDPLENRRQMALQCGADLALDPIACDAGLEIKQHTLHRGADVCIDYSGSIHAMQAALRGVAYLGTVVAGAAPGAWPAGLDLGAEAHMNRPTLIFSRACSEPNPDYPNWDEERIFDIVWRLLAGGAVQSIPLVQPIVDFDDLLVEYPKIAAQPDANIKLGVRF